MTMRQRKGIRAVILTLMLLLLAVTTFDSRNGFFVAQADSSDSVSDANMDIRRVETTPSDQRLAIAQAPLQTLPQTVPQAAAQVSPKNVEIEKIVTVEKVVEKVPEVMIDKPVEVEKIAKVVENAQVPVKAKPDPNPWESSDIGGDDSQLDAKPDLQPGSKRRHDHDPDPGAGLKPDPGDDPCTGAKGDRNRGHGNDEDGYDEDNPGRGGSDGVGSSRGRSGNRASGSREGHEGRGGRGNSCDRGDSKGRR